MIPTLFKCDMKTTDALVKQYMERNDFSKLRLLFDIKGLFYTIHSDDNAKMSLINDYKTGYFSYAEAIIRLINHWIGWCNIHLIEPQIYAFAETGDSLYHENINSTYKHGRKANSKKSLPTQALRDLFSEAVDANIKQLKLIFNTRGSGIRLIYLKNLEADFVPTYVIQEHRKMWEGDVTQVLNVTFSKDKDLVQSLDRGHLQMTKVPIKDYKFFSKDNGFTSIIKKKTVDPIGLPLNMFSIALAFIGDDPDSIKGLPRLC